MKFFLVDQCLWFVAISLIISHCFSSSEVVGSSPPQVPSMFVFGDSLVDHGNNNYLSSYAKSNYMPYGIDFYKGPTGRFSNGKTTIDLIGEEFGLPYLPAYEDALTVETILHGVNYASAAGGILNLTGQFLGDRFTFSQQVAKFKSTTDLLSNHMGEKNLSQHLSKSIAIINMGSNDYINNYLLPYLYPTSFYHTPVDYADLLIDLYANYLQALYNAGLRKFALGGVGPLGCIPNQLATGMALPGRCVSHVNDMVGLFNDRLRSLVDKLNANHTDAIFVYGNTYGAFGDILNNPSAYGFKVTDAGCCGIGRNQGQITCLPYSFPCINRTEYVFWDAFHPTEAVNAIIAKRAYTGPPSDCYPINLKQMAQI
ncbi:hypothetical protein AQUCO_01400039v1 [Aquilegia coerulea]|uniref:Uncharacterized protein n=1 Tax=Aquilegia coerulea TaxID=218851 RepID=A0A2G5DU48_AQUCA|nr:hypothetical protein AQUCO_01400039v1 [Aquilegia coerulea]